MRSKRSAEAAKRELERRAGLLALSDEPVGPNALLVILRDALDRYVEVCASKAPDAWDGRRVSFHPPKELIGKRYYLNGCDFTALKREPIWDRETQLAIDVPNAALRLAARLGKNYKEVLRVVTAIERQIAILEPSNGRIDQTSG